MKFIQKWRTPILHGALHDEKRVLLDEVANFMLTQEIDGKIHSNMSHIPEIQKFKQHVIVPAFKDFFELSNVKAPAHMDLWIGVTKNYMIRTHNHSTSTIVCVFYLFCEEHEENNGGEIILYDPRVNANRGFPEAFNEWFEPMIIKPKTGDYLIFPSFLYHSVDEFHGKMRLAMPVSLNI